MTNEIASIGIAVETDSVSKGITSLEQLAAAGPKVEKAMAGVEGAATKTGKTLKSLGEGSARGLDEVGKSAPKVADGMGRVTKSAEDAKRALAGINASVVGLGQASAATQSWTTSLGKIGPLVATVFSGAAITGFLGKVVAVQREFDVLNSSLKTVMGSSAAAEREMQWLKDFAKATPFGLAQATQGFVKMKALGLDPTRAALTSFGNTASAMGKDLNQMIEAVADASTGEFERLKEFGIKASKEKDQVSLTFQGVTKTIKNSSAEITKYLEDIGNASFGGAMEERAKTLDGTIAALGDSWDELFRTVSTNNVGGLIFDSVTLANGAIEDATTILRALGGVSQDVARDTGALAAMQGGLATTFETVAIVAANTLYVLRQTGDTLGGLAAGYKAFFSFDFDAVRAIGADMKANGEAARREIDATTARILNARKEQALYASYATRNASAANDPRRVDLGGKPRATSGGKSGKDAKELKAYNQELDQQKSLIAELSGLSSSFYKDWDSLNKQYAQGRISIKGLEEAQATLLAKQPAMVALAKEEAEVSRARVKAWEEEIKGWQKQVEERNKAAESAEDALLKARDEERAYQLAAVASITHAEAVARLALARADDNYQKALSKGTDGDILLALQREADARQALIEVMQQKGTREANEKATEAVAKDWEKTSQLVGDTLADYIMGGGKDAAQYLKRLFATLVLQPVVQTAVGGLMGTGSGAGASAAGGSNLLGSLQSGQSLWSAFSGGTSGAVASGVAGLGKLMGSSFLGELGSGIAAGGQLGIGGTASLMGTAGATTGAGMAIGAALPWVAGAAALYTLIKSFDDSGTPHSGMNARWSAKDGVYKSGEYSEFSALGLGQQWQSSQAKAVGDAVGGLAQTLGTSLDAFALAFGNKAGYVIETGFADDTSKDRAWGGLRIVEGSGSELVNWNSDRENKWAPRTFSDGEAGYQEYLDAVAVDVKAAFVAMDLPAWADQLLAAATDIDTLSAALQQIGAVKAVFDGLGKTMGMFAGLTGDAQARLLAASGSIDALASNAGAFYESFYSEADRAQKQREQQMQALEGAGLYIDPYQGGAAKEMFRKTVEEAMSSGQVELAAKLMAMSASFGTTADYGQGLLDDLAQAAKDTADAAQDAADKAKQAAAEALDVMAGLAQGFASQMNAAHSSMDAAGALWDRLDAAQGGSGTGYARIREQRLWDAMVQADYRQQIELAGQLTDMVLGRHQLEQANAQKLLDFGKSLRSYVEGLKIGALSPLTTGEKLAEAANQYADTLTKAKAGDESAMGSLQGISSSYLDLARQYFASSGDYTRIFNGVTGSLDALGVSSQSEAQLQLDVSSQSLAQLQQLQGILVGAYGQAESEFAVEKDLLQRQVNELLRTADGIEAVRDLLGGMPAELAAQLNGGAGTGTGSFATLAQSYVSLLGGAGGSSTDPRYVASAMGHVNAANWKSELSNAMGLLTDPGARAQMQAIFDAVAKMKGIDGSHANGLGYVPFDNYMAQLHKGERVLTAEENRAYTPTWSSYGSGGGVEALVSEVKALRVEIVQLKASGVQNAQMLARAQVESNMAAAGDVVKGVGQATVRAAYAETVQPKGYK